MMAVPIETEQQQPLQQPYRPLKAIPNTLSNNNNNVLQQQQQPTIAPNSWQQYYSMGSQWGDQYPIVQSTKLWLKQQYHQSKPWSEFMDRTRISRPQSLGEFMNRVNHNLVHFKVNYSLIACLVLVWALITNLWLVAIVGVAVGGFAWVASNNSNSDIQVPFVNKVLTKKQAYAALVAFTVPALWLVGAVSVMFWVAAVSAMVIVGHASVVEKGVETDFV